MTPLSLQHINAIVPYQVTELLCGVYARRPADAGRWVVDADGVVNYATMILRNDNPRFAQVVEEYTQSIQLLSQKPE